MYLNGYIFRTIVVLLLKMINAAIFEEKSHGVVPDSYDKLEPPWKKGHPVHVYFTLKVTDIDTINDEKMEYSIQFYLSELWKDDRLNLSILKDGSEYETMSSYLTTLLWKPDTVFDNAKNGDLFALTLPNTYISIAKDGNLRKLSRYNLIVACSMTFHFYPMDTQECYLKLTTLSSPDFKVKLHWLNEKPGNEYEDSIRLMNSIQPFKYVMHTPQQQTFLETSEIRNSTYLNAKFIFTRRLSGTIFNVYIPSTLVVILSWISFWVEVDAVPARVTLGVTTLLTLTTQISQARAGLPPISYLTAMDIWLFTCLIFVFSALLEFSFSYQLSVSSKQSSIANAKSLQGARNTSELMIRRSRQSKDSTLHQRTALDQLTKMKAKCLDKICRKLYPSLFFLFAFIYWIYFLHLK